MKDSASLCTVYVKHRRLSYFLDELRALCNKHDIAIAVEGGGIAEILTVYSPLEKLGELAYIHAGRTGYTLSTTPVRPFPHSKRKQ